MKAVDVPKKLKADVCRNCWKPSMLCLCPLFQEELNRIPVLILQHPQECSKPLGTARMISLGLAKGVHRIGLSWSSLSAALRQKAETADWAVLYLGSLKESGALGDVCYRFTDSKGKARDLNEVRGLVVLDGNWKQAKTLYWRNPWLKKLARIQINPSQVSLYRDLRKEPRKTAVSTLEATAYALQHLKENEAVAERLLSHFSEWLQKAKKYY